MAMLVAGKCLGVTERNAGTPGGNTWVERTIHVIDGVRTTEATVVRNFRGALPEAGELVALEVGVRAFPLKSGGVGWALTAFGRRPNLEATLELDASASV